MQLHGIWRLCVRVRPPERMGMEVWSDKTGTGESKSLSFSVLALYEVAGGRMSE